MNYSEVVSNVKVYNLEEAIRGSKYPMSVDIAKLNGSITPTVEKLAQSPTGHGHDTFLNGILVSFDLTFTNKAWVEAERYKFLNFISSQSTMHRITRFDLNNSYIEYTDPRIIDIMKEKVAKYNEDSALLAKYRDELSSSDDTNSELSEIRDKADHLEEQLKEDYLRILYSNPAGFRLTASMVTNYRQLKTIYQQRRTHRLPEWRAFCAWIETLPESQLITGKHI